MSTLLHLVLPVCCFPCRKDHIEESRLCDFMCLWSDFSYSARFHFYQRNQSYKGSSKIFKYKFYRLSRRFRKHHNWYVRNVSDNNKLCMVIGYLLPVVQGKSQSATILILKKRTSLNEHMLDVLFWCFLSSLLLI